ncbi:MAG: diguanylate cyclase, partial [Planctomycetes bacterium]|nr:diguanylate cyclase [Planctomycetota bacterium]
MNSKKTRKILAVDDEQTNLILLSRLLGKMGIVVLPAKDALAGMQIAINEKPDLILLDIMMPEINGFEMCRRLKANSETSSIPVIFISAKSQTSDKIEGLEIGGVDYITKPFDMGELKARVSNTLKTLELEEKILSLANTDELTGLPNRRRFFDILERELHYVKIKNKPLAVAMIDIDHFKNVNDTYGHLDGDAVLRQMGKVLQENMYPLDVVARYGGEEFIVIMPETSLTKATQAANRLCTIIDGLQWEISNKQISVT